ncbi:MAG: L-aspartate oxidase [Lachnospiraceae bacterium]|nr:L-aspartate oxidase [Lachnospiraceae bacterium]
MNSYYDVIIVGTGVAGLFTALELPDHLNILMITRDETRNSDSYLAQGGICVLKNKDDFESYYEDTMKAGRYQNNTTSVKIMIEESPSIIRKLMRYGVDFDRNKNGSLSFTREGGHSAFRILHYQDITGKAITETLLKHVESKNHITILEYTRMIDLICENNFCHGIIARNKQGNTFPIFSKETILATGGLGGIFRHSTNFPHISGDSFALALLYKIKIQDINYIQIHPTTLYSKKSGRSFLISESVRGEGAFLLNSKGERFIDELLPRDVVSAAILNQMREDDKPYVYLSVSHLPKEEILNHFPNIYRRCLEEGYDLTKDCVPITPAQHYFMGGIQTDTYAQTSCSHLYAVGETGCNGVHGANRLASNSLLESLVFSRRAAQKMETEIQHTDMPAIHIDKETIHNHYGNDQVLDETFKSLIWKEIQRKDSTFYDQWYNNGN